MLEEFIESRREMETILLNEMMGFLGLSAEGKPYVVPLTYAYADGKIIFHCALQGKKLDYIKTNPHVCFTVGRQFGEVCAHPQGAQCRKSHDSVICYGIAKILEDKEERLKALNTFNHRIAPGAKDIVLSAISGCYAVEIRITHMTGRQQREGTERKYWEYNF